MNRSSQLILVVLLTFGLEGRGWSQDSRPDPGLQHPENPPMEVIVREAPPLPKIPKDFEIRPGYTLIDSLEQFRQAIKRDNQKIRVKPGVYRAKTVDPPIKLPLDNPAPGTGRYRGKGMQEHIFAVNGSNNFFDLRGVVFETPVSLQGKLSRRPHVSDSWHINGANNVFIGGFFQNVLDQPYPEFQVTNNEFEVCGDRNRFYDCTFVIRGSVPYGYSDFYGKGGPNFGRLNKHCFMSIDHANGTELVRCRVFQQSFGHCVHFHTVDGVLIKDCAFTGALRPTNDIFKEKVGRAVDYDYKMMYRKEQPIPRDLMIPLVEDGIRSYDNVRNITVINTTVERMRGAVQLLCGGDVILKNVTVREAGDFSFDVSVGNGGKVLLENCRSDLAYNPVFNLMRGELPKNARYEVAIMSPPEGARPTPRTSLGIISGERCEFVLKDETSRPIPADVNFLTCGGHRRPLVDSVVENQTSARLILNDNVRNCTIRSLGPVEDNGKDNRILTLNSKD
ncbi:hypothetical protein [Roseibacillus persicicus]|uniref:hypothetical protein n=1 Tax=Roseibacillus persicicus TaxID=454148 RepID=UPI00280F5A76|nr:hypothetical protein [Roseibacillus persicicus]MDQ8189065.1 hypothetical protein [Roseibacillus persicicus]